MPIASERTPPVAAVGKIAEPESSAHFFGRRRLAANSWQPQNHLLGLMLLPPMSEAEEPAEAESILGSDEVTFGTVSLSSSQTVIAVTDEQARQIMDSFGEDAFPPQ